MVNEDLSSVYFWQTQPPVQGSGGAEGVGRENLKDP